MTVRGVTHVQGRPSRRPTTTGCPFGAAVSMTPAHAVGDPDSMTTAR